MNFGNMGAGLGAMYPGMVEGRKNEATTRMAELQAQDLDEQQQSQAIRGNALLQLFAGGQGMPGGGSPTPPMPGQSSVPQASPTAPAGSPPIGTSFPPTAGPSPSPAPPVTMRPPDGAASLPAPSPVAPPPGPPASGGGGDAMAGAEVPLNGVGEQGGRPTIHGGVPNGPLTWQMIGSAIARANPNAPPQLIARAIDKFAPMMTTESQMQWHIMKMQQDEKLVRFKQGEQNKRLDTREENMNARQELGLEQRQNENLERTKRIELTNENRLHISGMTTESRELIAKLRETGMDRRQFEQLKQRDDWKTLDRETKEKLAGWIIAGQNQRAAGVQEGQNTRAAGVQEGQNQRNEATIAGANQRAEGRNVTALDIARQRTEMQKWLADGKPVTSTQRALAEKGQSYASAISTIDDAMSAIAKGHAEGKNVVGLVGKARGINEIAGNIAGWTDATTRNDFVQKIQILRTQLPKLLTGSTVSSKDERARLNQILQGLEAGSTKQATFADLKYLKEKLTQLAPALSANTNQGDIRASRNVTPAPSGGAPPAGGGTPAGGTLGRMTPDIKARMDAALAAGMTRADVEAGIRSKYNVDPSSSIEDPGVLDTSRSGGPR